MLLKDILPLEYYNHFLLLVCSVRILCDTKECSDNNSCASEMLRKYVQDFPALYGSYAVGYNVHNLIHLSADVLLFGNLDSYSAFKFENCMQHLKKKIKKHNQPLQQLNNRLFEMNKHLPAQNVEKIPYAVVNYCIGGLSYRDLIYNNCNYSTSPPNNYLFIESKVFVIEQIIKKNLEIYIIGHFVSNAHVFFFQNHFRPAI